MDASYMDNEAGVVHWVCVVILLSVFTNHVIPSPREIKIIERLWERMGKLVQEYIVYADDGHAMEVARIPERRQNELLAEFERRKKAS